MLKRSRRSAAAGAAVRLRRADVIVIAGCNVIRSRPVARSVAVAGTDEIVLPGGVLVRVDAHVDGRALRRILGALSER